MTEPIATTLLILTTFCVSLWVFTHPSYEQRYLFRPEDILAGKEYYRLVSSAFLHAGWGHLLLNMYTLYSFGGILERRLGPGQLLLVYFGSVVGGNLLALFIHRHHEYAAYGASGGVCGLIFAYVLQFPHARMVLFPLPYAVPAWAYAIAFLIGSFYALKVRNDAIGHDAHLGGSMIGLLIMAYLHPELGRRHWVVFLTLLLVAGLILAYILKNPLFLPISSFFQERSARSPRLNRSRSTTPSVAKSNQAGQGTRNVVTSGAGNRNPDWLREQIEVHVGKLEKDPSGLHDWIDKFGRTYDVLGATAEHFELKTFSAALLDHLNTVSVRFVIIDTTQLKDTQIDLLRPVMADLPEAQFNRVIRSYGFNSNQRR